MESGAAKVIAKAKAKKAPSLMKPQITVQVGVSQAEKPQGVVFSEPEMKIFHVYRDFICFHSKYFWKAITDIESSQSFGPRPPIALNLHRTQPKLFGMFIFWLYNQHLDMENAMDGDYDHNKLNFETLASLWIFANRYQVPGLQNAIVGKILVLGDEIYGIGPALELAYFKNSCDCLRKVLVARAASMSVLHPIDSQDIPKDAWQAMFILEHKKVCELRAGKLVELLQASDYYVPVPEPDF